MCAFYTSNKHEPTPDYHLSSRQELNVKAKLIRSGIKRELSIMDRAKHCGSIFRNKNDEFFYECEFCDEEFLSSITFENHMKCVHPGNRWEFECETCSRKFDSNKELLEHEKSLHYSFVCNYCNERFKTTGGRSRHVSAKHGSKPDIDLKRKRGMMDEFWKIFHFLL